MISVIVDDFLEPMNGNFSDKKINYISYVVQSGILLTMAGRHSTLFVLK